MSILFLKNAQNTKFIVNTTRFEPNVSPGESLTINKTKRTFNHDDIVVASILINPNASTFKEDILLRIDGIPGDKVIFSDNNVTIGTQEYLFSKITYLEKKDFLLETNEYISLIVDKDLNNNPMLMGYYIFKQNDIVGILEH